MKWQGSRGCERFLRAPEGLGLYRHDTLMLLTLPVTHSKQRGARIIGDRPRFHHSFPMIVNVKRGLTYFTPLFFGGSLYRIRCGPV
jgi:hypothetical protein